jgi:hypothetical protein
MHLNSMNMREVSMQDVVAFLNHGHLSNDKFEFVFYSNLYIVYTQAL